MRKQESSLQIGKYYLFVFFLMSLAFISCSKKISFLNSSVVPAARGTIHLDKDNNNNYDINIDLTDLAEASRLSPAKQTYIVWMITDQNLTKNIGQLNSSKTGMANKLKASFKTVTAFKPTKIFITAEDEPSIQYPSDQIILTTDFFNN